MNNSVWLAILAAIFYGFGGPFMKYAHQLGISTRDFIFVASLTTLVVAMFWPTNESLFSTLNTRNLIVITFVTGILFTGGFISINQALSGPSSLASVVLVISATSPLLGSLISLFYLGEKGKVVLPMLIIGSLLTVAGAIIVVLSAKNT